MLLMVGAMSIMLRESIQLCEWAAKEVEPQPGTALRAITTSKRKFRVLQDRFWNLVQCDGLDNCWPWIGPTDPDGYGNFHVRVGELGLTRNTKVRAHRLAFRLINGRWPDKWALHGCDNPACCNAVNSEHVHEGSPRQNMQEKVARNRHPSHMRGGEQHAVAKLTNDQADEIRRRYAAGGISQQKLAQEFGITQPDVSLIVNYKIYKTHGGV